VSHDDAPPDGRALARPPGSGLAAKGQLFLVERRLPRACEQQLAVLQFALSGAASRFGARGADIRYLCSIFVAGQDRLISLFTAEDAETVRAVNEAALIPFASVEPAVELPGPG
jgi:hypothetical protein